MTASKNFKGSAGHSGLLETALSCAARRWPVIRLRGMVPAIAKKTGGHGIHDATTDVAIFRDWWARFPKANIEIATGDRADLFALDFDFGHGGDSRLSDLKRRLWPLPITIALPPMFVSDCGELLIYRLTPESAAAIGVAGWSGT